MKSKNSQNKENSPTNRADRREGVIISPLGVAVDVLFDDGERCQVRVKRKAGHVVGDRVSVVGEVLRRLPRRTELRRRDARGKTLLLGANLDVLGVVVAPLPPPPSGFIDRAIVAARAANLQPFLVANKCDMEEASGFVSALRHTYDRAIEVFPLSARNKTGIDALLDFLARGHRGAFVGTSGVGKSSLLNAVCPGIDLPVGEISDYGQGTHTTTVSTLHSLAGGGELIDTPGFRDFGLVDITAEELALHFPGFEELTSHTCRFRNCRHLSEPGCSVVDLVNQGKVAEERYQTYLEILAEVQASEEENQRRGWKS